MRCESNTHLTTERDPAGNITIELTDELDNFGVSLDPHFALFSCHAVMTSGVRSRTRQLELIREKAMELNLVPPHVTDVLTADLNQIFPWGNDSAPLWRILWSQLLSDGQMINPPEPATAEFEYIHADGRRIPPGHEIGISEHQEKIAIDIARADLGRIAFCLTHAHDNGISLRQLVEPKNGCVHVVNLT